MAITSVCCPSCETTLKLANRPEEGKKVSCKKCEKLFVAADNIVDETGIKAKPEQPKPALPPKGRKNGDDNDLPRKQIGRAMDDDDDDRPGSKKGRRDPDDDEE